MKINGTQRFAYQLPWVPRVPLLSLALLVMGGCATELDEMAVGKLEQALSPQCAAAEHRQFDFWRGRWEVRDPGGNLVGFNTIKRIQDGCALQEFWEGGAGSTGTSLNFYNQFTKQWHQTWVDSSGAPILIAGGVVGDKMVMTGTRPRPAGGTALHRISWEPLPGSKVRQLWDVSLDGGTNWIVLFDGLYSKRP